MRVLFLEWKEVAHPLSGGSELLIHRLADGLHRRGHEVTVLAGDPVGVRDYRTVAAGGPHTQYLRDPLHAHRIGPFDVVVDVCNGIPFFSPLWTRTPVLALVNHVHLGMWDEWFSTVPATIGKTIETRIMPMVYRRCPFVAVSESTRDALVSIGVAEPSISIVHNGVDLIDEDDIVDPDDALVFAAIGRMVPHKRFDLMLRAWERVRNVLGEGTLEIIGDGPMRAELEAAAPPHTVFRGRVSDVARDDLLDRAWCLIQPSRLEGWGLVVIEAAARGVPTIGFDVLGTRDAVAPDQSGLLVDSEDELVEAWLALARDRSERSRLSKGAVERAAEFGWDATVEAFESVLARTAGVAA